MRIRVQGPSGQTTLTLDDGATVGELRSKISEATGLSAFVVKTGMRPQPLEILELDAYPDSITLSDATLKLANSTLILSARETDTASVASTPQRASATPSQQPPLNDKTAKSRPKHGMLNLEKKQQPDLNDPPEVDVAEWGLKLILRIMPDDNSCLFRALGTCILSDEIESATELRDVVATRIQSDPETFNAAILGMNPDEYCRKIKDPNAWGGEIETRIISEAFNIGVDSIDVETQHVYSYNQEAQSRCIIIYSGIHYDTVALGGPGVPDVKQFPISEYAPIREKAVEICQILKGRHYYTNTSKFTVRCDDCGWQGSGEQAAQDHHNDSGHFNFKEA